MNVRMFNEMLPAAMPAAEEDPAVFVDRGGPTDGLTGSRSDGRSGPTDARAPIFGSGYDRDAAVGGH